jgi:poly-gamma-glutamate capsule biosynthesis protein CapA/YwtB (metallophosphatase superfamily)
MTSIVACGDVGARRSECATIFAGCRDALHAADLAIAQLETSISERGSRAPNARLAMRAPVSLARALHAAGIDVVSFAGNHCLDFGYEAFADTLQHCAHAGVQVCGAGENLESARRPLVCTVGRHRLAVFAACSILPEGYAAEPAKPGCAPLRAFTVYQAVEPDQPGTPPRTCTFAHRGDLDALTAAVRVARSAHDVVLVSLHWGIHMVPAVLADYQRQVAHALIDAGADAVLGHHPHVLKGIELYRGKAIFYSLGNFAIEQPHIWDPAILESASFRHLVSLNPQWDVSRRYMLPENTRATGLAKLVLHEDGSMSYRFCPAWIDDTSAPHMLRATDPHFAVVREFLETSTRTAGLATRFEPERDELVLV